jgi:hypothetical protein
MMIPKKHRIHEPQLGKCKIFWPKKTKIWKVAISSKTTFKS